MKLVAGSILLLSCLIEARKGGGGRPSASKPSGGSSSSSRPSSSSTGWSNGKPTYSSSNSFSKNNMVYPG